MPQKNIADELHKIFSSLNKTNRQYALAILRSLQFAQEQEQCIDKKEEEVAPEKDE